ncbi:carbonic anhydrase [Sphingomonas sp. SUN019]|uniref:carbonic anhydrase n=1 Tax=Sphingomonas sp. SUN019 TaxID=2937788 RepID=UPI002164D15B|nr:carbonic anhydrase [Sphingomonas sp. SUN019]UVO51307.1 carbonic anhydrase [Sphingomonas sp. SUN019]
MNELIGRVVSFEKQVFPDARALYAKLTTDGQSPKALMISCADSRIVPEHIMQAEAGDLFVCRNAGNIVPPYSNMNGGVSSTVEYAVEALGVRDIIVCGHSDCGAMKGLMNPASTAKMPNVVAWLRHSHAAKCVVDGSYPEMDGPDAVRAVSLENVVVQLAHLRTHPSVAAGMARGDISLHGWFVDIHSGHVLGLDGETGRFMQIHDGAPVPVAHPAAQRLAADFIMQDAAE